ncbi:MAG: YHYH protein [Flavobacteriaceae bacterium]|nr:YHYH protein [Flavobacteriaceae bacterium]
MNFKKISLITLTVLTIFSCSQNDTSTKTSDCTSDIVKDTSVGPCTETLTFTHQYSETISGTTRIITSNSIPDHMVGLFGGGSGSLNPNAIAEQNETYNITTTPSVAISLTSLISTTGSGPNLGPQYSFGILFSGVELDPIPAEPFPHEGMMSPNVNWEWNLEALNVDIGLDCNSAHVQPQGKYHYHGKPTLYLDNLGVPTNAMTLIGYAADGFPIYYKYAYSTATDNTSAVIEMTSSYQLKTGDRPGDGVTAPCDTYNGVYSNDYEYIDGLGTLDKANGRTGVTLEYPSGTYYYIMTDDFPSIPRYFKGTPSQDFKIGK